MENFELTPLDTPLPVRSIDSAKRAAKQLQKAFPEEDGTRTKLSKAQRVIAFALGYRSFSHLVESMRGGITPAHIDRETRELRQHAREMATLREAYPYIDDERLAAFLSKWRLVNWDAIDQGYYDLTRATSQRTRQQKQETTSRIREPASLMPHIPDNMPGGGSPTSTLRFHCDLNPFDNFDGYKPTSRKTRRPSKAAVALDALFADPLTISMPDPFDTDIWNLQTLPSEDRYMPATLWFASEKAKQLAVLAPNITFACAYAVTARTYGYRDWFELHQQFVGGKRSRFDDELDLAERRRRHQWQVFVLQASVAPTRTCAVGLRVDWQPTSLTFNVDPSSEPQPADVAHDPNKPSPPAISVDSQRCCLVSKSTCEKVLI